MDSLTKERKLTRNLKRRFPDCWNRFIIRSLFLKVPCLPLAVLTPGLLFLEHCTGSSNSLRWVIVKGFSLCYVMALIRRRDARLCMLYKIHYNFISLLADYLHLQLRHTHFSHKLDFHMLQGSGNYQKYTFFPRTIQEWNLLLITFITSLSFEYFRNRVSIFNYSSVLHMPPVLTHKDFILRSAKDSLKKLVE